MQRVNATGGAVAADTTGKKFVSTQILNVEIWQTSPFFCVCLLLEDLLQSGMRGGRGTVKDLCYEVPPAEAHEETRGFLN